MQGEEEREAPQGDMECPGCGGVRPRDRIMCPRCRSNPKVAAKIRWRTEKAREQAKVDAAAEQETAGMPKPRICSLYGERMVLKMLRGEPL